MYNSIFKSTLVLTLIQESELGTHVTLLQNKAGSALLQECCSPLTFHLEIGDRGPCCSEGNEL